jgi:arsenate reductase
MAEAFFNARAAERGIADRAESAGLLGVGAMHPLVVRCVEETGVPMEGLKPKQVTKEMIERAETIVAFGRVTSDHTAIKFSVSEDWSTADPAGLSYGALCEVRDEIARNVDDLIERLATKSSCP